jgi:periplasmic copper chaperone A
MVDGRRSGRQPVPRSESRPGWRHAHAGLATAVAALALVLPGVDAVAAQPASPARAVDATPTVIQPWIRATRPGQQNAAAYLGLRSASGDTLVAVRPPADVADRGELHTMKMDGDLMLMREVESFRLAPGRTLHFNPGGNHVMLVGLKRPLATGDRIDLVLVFSKAGEVTVRAEVRDEPPTRRSPAARS